MNATDLRTLFDAHAFEALSPWIALTAGALLLLLASITSVPRLVRGAIVLAGLAAAAALDVRLMLRAPIGTVLDGTFVSNHATAAWGSMFIVATALAWAFSRHYYAEDRPFQTEHDVLMLATPIGMALMAGAQDLIVFFIGLELLSIPLYALAAFRRNRAHSVEAGLKYFLLGAFAAAFFLYGAGLLYASTGTLSIARMSEDAMRAKIFASPMALVGVALVASSLFFKISVFPFHVWVPDVYEGSPTPVTGLMATGTKAAAFAFLLSAANLLPHSAALSVALIALATMAVGNLGALVQKDVKRMLAYSGVAHAGTLLLALAGYLAYDSTDALERQRFLEGTVNAGLFYMAAYVATAGGAFGLLALLERDGRGTTLDALRGLGTRRPFVAAALTLFMLSLGGIPATGGFLGKWFVFSIALRADLVAVSVIGILLSVVALGYYLRVIVAMYMQPSSESAPASHPPVELVAATIASTACAVLVVALGVMPSWFLAAL
jgi:NADH-quinone oxidoreductase subunit N